jgi:hypothetical protein
MLYPPVNELTNGYGADGSVLTVPDSGSGTNITIVNQNQIIFDRYYQDPYYQRGGFFGGSGCWDPYYYNPGGYRQDHRWQRGEYHYGYTPGTDTPKPKTPRRKQNLRSEAPADNPPNQTEVVSAQAPAATAQTESVKAAESQPVKPDSAKKEAPKPADNKRSLRPVETPAPTPSEPEKQPDPPKDKNEDKKPRREGNRDR